MALNPPERLNTPLRPERMFGMGRKVRLAVILAGFLFVIGFILQQCNRPLEISSMAKSANAASPSQTPLRMELPQVATLAPAISTPAVVGDSVNCWALVDVDLGPLVIPAESLVRVTGWTGARGGLVQVQGSWEPESDFRCAVSPHAFERPYLMSPSPTAARYSQPSVVRTVIVTVPAPTSTPVNGIWRDADGCWMVNLSGVREIWVNGRGTSNGKYCGITDFRVVVVVFP